FFFFTTRRPPCSTHFPYTTLFRSLPAHASSRHPVCSGASPASVDHGRAARAADRARRGADAQRWALDTTRYAVRAGRAPHGRLYLRAVDGPGQEHRGLLTIAGGPVA